MYIRILNKFVNTVKFCQSNIHSFAKNMENLTSEQLLEAAQSFVPKMTPEMYKGQCGRIGVIGGCKEYTGAPYFAGITALKVGADLSHVFCTEAAAPVIKSYSPELIVHPILDSSNCIAEVGEWLPRIHTLVVGPGLGRDPSIFGNFKGIFQSVIELGLPLVVDADGVYFITQDPNIIKGYKKAVLTPNGIEFIRLYEKVFGETPKKEAAIDNTRNLAEALSGVTIVQKGKDDIISNGTMTIICSKQGSVRRCGGQGDLLSGSMGTFMYWANKTMKDTQSGNQAGDALLEKLGPNLTAAFGACFLTRECNRLAYLSHKRSMTTTDMIACIHQAFETYFEKCT